MAVKNMAASVLTRLKNQAKEERIPFQVVLQLFLQIRLFAQNETLLTQWKAFASAKEVGLSFEDANQFAHKS